MFNIINGNMLEELDKMEENSVDAIVTDPPYEISFMSKSWDAAGVSFKKETWKKCLRVLKPGGHLLSFAAARTQHRIACAIEDAGFEIRDTIMWVYGSGFPKSMNIGIAIDKKLGIESEFSGVKPGHEEFVGRDTKGHMNYSTADGGFHRPWMDDEELSESYHYQKVPTSEQAKLWKGFGTQIKPAYEPVIMARKPLTGTVVDNIIEYGVGGINIDECRVPFEDTKNPATNPLYRKENGYKIEHGADTEPSSYALKKDKGEMNINNKGRFPSNVILTYDDTDFDEVCGGFPITHKAGNKKNMIGNDYNNSSYKIGTFEHNPDYYGDSGSASRYFYCAKASKRDRDEGLDELETKQSVGGGGGIGNYLTDVNSCSGKFGSEKAPHKNYHPTVKPTSLMQYLVRLVSPKGAVILDPFMGSGSTGKAVAYENNDRDANYSFIGIELNEEYCKIAQARIEYALDDKTKLDTIKDTARFKKNKDTNDMTGRLF